MNVINARARTLTYAVSGLHPKLTVRTIYCSLSKGSFLRTPKYEVIMKSITNKLIISNVGAFKKTLKTVRCAPSLIRVEQI